MSSEYQLRPAPAGYQRLVTSVFVAGLLALLSLVALVSAGLSRSAPPTLLILLACLLAVASLWALLAIWLGSRRYPDWRSFHSRELPPKLDDELLVAGLELPIARNVHRADRLLSALFAVTGVGLLLVLAWAGMKPLPLAGFAAVATLVCLWNLGRLKKIDQAPGPTAIRATREGIEIPLNALEVVSATRASRREQGPLRIPWHEIEQWTVEAGGSDGPDLYRLRLASGGTLELYRSTVKGRELALLDYVRAAGVTVRLEDSVSS